MMPLFMQKSIIAAGTAYLIGSFTSLFLPQDARLVSQFAMILEAGELPFVLWLLIWGARARPSQRSAFPSKQQAGAAR
jgi:hypothetical protein